MPDEASYSGEKGWGSKKSFAIDDWGLTDADFADLNDDETKAQIAEDEKYDD